VDRYWPYCTRYTILTILPLPLPGVDRYWPYCTRYAILTILPLPLPVPIPIGEPNYEWAKPIALANWETEMEVTVNGKPCAPPNCRVKRSGYLQTMVVDARAIMGGKCRHVDLLVGLRIKPVGGFDGACVLNDDGNCKTAGVWHGYDSKLCTKSATGCTYSGARSSPAAGAVHTFISQVISF
jgi:hypothetical protein